MKISSRLLACALLGVTLASCNTWNGFKNSFPVRMLDEIGTEAMSLISENGAPAGGPLKALPERARQVQNRGMYTSRVPAAQLPRQSMAAR